MKVHFFTVYFFTFHITLVLRDRANYINWCFVVVVVALLFYVHGKHLRSCRDGQLT